MIHSTFSTARKASMFLLLMVTQSYVFAQDKITIDAEGVKSWFERNWMWVAGAVVLILLLALLGSGRKKNRVVNQRKTTTVIKDPEGNVKSVTTTEDTI